MLLIYFFEILSCTLNFKDLSWWASSHMGATKKPQMGLTDDQYHTVIAVFFQISTQNKANLQSCIQQLV